MKNNIDSSYYLMHVIDFIAEIGLSIEIAPGVNGFTPGIEIAQGGIRVDPAVTTASNLLHEAGHLAIMPGSMRHYLNGNLMVGLIRAFDECATHDPESPLCKALIQCSDPEATAWAWAAGLHLGIPGRLVIEDRDYAGSGESIRFALETCHYLGINGLDRAGMCAGNSRSAYLTGLPVYPSMAIWVQPSNLLTK